MTDEKYQDEKNTDEDYQEKDILEDEGFKKSQVEKRTALIDEIKSGKAAADKKDGKWTTWYENGQKKETQKVKISDIDMPFGSMVVFMVKWAIASIPAILILMVLFAIFGGLFLGVFATLAAFY